MERPSNSEASFLKNDMLGIVLGAFPWIIRCTEKEEDLGIDGYVGTVLFPGDSLCKINI